VNNPAGLTVMQAFTLDKKIDDGLPVSGNIKANYISGSGGPPPILNSTNASTDSNTTCYNTTSNAYSVSINNGSGINCAISVKVKW